ncbi:OmpA family protein [Microbaculum marinum]|uniref:OmpA family protein n=1 Tax=Microbaculum marinum TaxID=1764581 RepID=A0AAW9RXL3_9HYPH
MRIGFSLLAALAICSVAAAAPVGAEETGAASQGKDVYRLEIRRTGDALEIAGSVPDQATRNAIVDAASSAAPDLPKTIVLTEVEGAPPDFAAAAVRATTLMDLVAAGDFVLAGQHLQFSGAAYHEKAKQALVAATASGWPPGYVVEASDVVAGPDGPPIAAPDCERALAALIEAHPIEFEAGRADVTGDSKVLVDRVAYTAARCPGAMIAVAGHTDSDGTDESNYRLSLDRARTVVDLLVADGIPERRFTALGYGESRPLRSNASLAGKARNRRIEFVLRD